MPMRGEELVMFCWPDLSGLARGRAFPVADLHDRLVKGIGWLPVCQALTPFHHLAEGDPWGAIDDVQLIGDPKAQVRVDLWDDAPPLHFFIADAYELDGSPWEGCLRGFLKDALDAFEAETGLRLFATFEQEFHLESETVGPDFSLESLRLEAAFGALVTAALRAARAEPETFEPEYGAAQYEVTCRPALGVAGADRALIAREVIREVARREGRRASFTPIVAPEQVGNGVHVHFSLIDEAGRPAGYDEARAGNVSEVMGRFAAGVLRQLPSLTAFTAPTLVSYMRLVPGHWSAGFNAMGIRNREAALRVAPIWRGPGGDPARQFNLEFRACDAGASPHLVLALLVRAGLEGVREKLPAPALLEVPPADLSDGERAKLGIRRLPGSLDEALAVLAEDKLVKSWFPPKLWEVYFAPKRTEMSMLGDLEPKELCERYRNVY
jgi:glutamine synthetase